jgi:hypothetical protein
VWKQAVAAFVDTGDEEWAQKVRGWLDGIANTG